MKLPLNDRELTIRFDEYIKVRQQTIESNKRANANSLHMPKLPSDISETLAFRAIINGEILSKWGPFRCVERRVHPDIVADNHPIGVKGSVMENGGWQSITNDDLACDCIVWLNFYPFVADNNKILPATIFYNPKGNIPEGINKTTYNDMCSFYEVSNEYEVITSISFPPHIKLENDISVDDWKIKQMWGNFI